MIKIEIELDDDMLDNFIEMYEDHLEYKYDKKPKKMSEAKLAKLQKLIAEDIKAEIMDNALDDVYQYIDFENIEQELNND